MKWYVRQAVLCALVGMILASFSLYAAIVIVKLTSELGDNLLKISGININIIKMIPYMSADVGRRILFWAPFFFYIITNFLLGAYLLMSVLKLNLKALNLWSVLHTTYLIGLFGLMATIISYMAIDGMDYAEIAKFVGFRLLLSLYSIFLASRISRAIQTQNTKMAKSGKGQGTV